MMRNENLGRDYYRRLNRWLARKGGPYPNGERLREAERDAVRRKRGMPRGDVRPMP